MTLDELMTWTRLRRDGARLNAQMYERWAADAFDDEGERENRALARDAIRNAQALEEVYEALSRLKGLEK